MAPKNQLVKVEAVEILPPEARLPAGLPTTAVEMDRLLEQKFADLLRRPVTLGKCMGPVGRGGARG